MEQYWYEGETGFVIARSVTLKEFPSGQLVVAKAGLSSIGRSLAGEKEESSKVVLKPWLLAALS